MTDRHHETKQVAVQAARVQGCVCDVDTHITPDGHIELAHDEWCPLIRVMEERPPEARTQGVIYRPQP